MGTSRSKYRIWDDNVLVAAFCRRPKDPRAIKLTVRNAQERALGIKYYIPAEKSKVN